MSDRSEENTQSEYYQRGLGKAKQECAIWVANIPRNVTEDEVRDVFKAFGEIVKVDIPEQREGKQPYVFVHFATPEMAGEAIEKGSGLKIRNYFIHARRALESNHKGKAKQNETSGRREHERSPPADRDRPRYPDRRDDSYRDRRDERYPNRYNDRYDDRYDRYSGGYEDRYTDRYDGRYPDRYADRYDRYDGYASHYNPRYSKTYSRPDEFEDRYPPRHYDRRDRR